MSLGRKRIEDQLIKLIKNILVLIKCVIGLMGLKHHLGYISRRNIRKFMNPGRKGKMLSLKYRQNPQNNHYDFIDTQKYITF